MSDSLESFLKPNQKPGNLSAGGSFQCSECYETVHEGSIDEETMILHYQCSKKHKNEVKL